MENGILKEFSVYGKSKTILLDLGSFFICVFYPPTKELFSPYISTSSSYI